MSDKTNSTEQSPVIGPDHQIEPGNVVDARQRFLEIGSHSFSGYDKPEHAEVIEFKTPEQRAREDAERTVQIARSAMEAAKSPVPEHLRSSGAKEVTHFSGHALGETVVASEVVEAPVLDATTANTQTVHKGFGERLLDMFREPFEPHAAMKTNVETSKKESDKE